MAKELRWRKKFSTVMPMTGITQDSLRENCNFEANARAKVAVLVGVDSEQRCYDTIYCEVHTYEVHINIYHG